MVLKRLGQVGGVLVLAAGMSLGASLLGALRLSSGAAPPPATTVLDEHIKLPAGADAVIHEVALNDGTPCVTIIGKNAVAVTCGWPTAPTLTAVPGGPLQ